MKIGIITDVHNNVIALEAILDVFHKQSIDCIFCCGDVIGIGPFPEETVQRMKQIENLYAVCGNHEKYLLDGLKDTMYEEEKAFHKWEHQLLSQDSISFLASLPNQIDLEVEGVSCTILHYAMKDTTNYQKIIKEPTGKQLSELFKGINSTIILYGHDHKGCITQYNNCWYINVGSLGCPGINRNVACGGILTIEKGKIDFEDIKVIYDANQVLDVMNELQCPALHTIQRIFYGR